MKFSALIYFFFGFVIISSCKINSKKDEMSITIFCAAGLVDVITELADSFSKTNSVNIKLNLASSGTLARQLKQGHEADIYISANIQWADYAYSLGLFSQQKILYRNKLVFICPLNREFENINFISTYPPEFKGRLSMGDPDHVPAGQYAMEALLNLGWWKSFEGRILPAKDARSALMPVELSECELGIVYYTDALASKKVKIINALPENTHSPVIFTALLSESAARDANDFYQMLNSNNFENTWMKYGFTPAPGIE